MPPNRAVFRQDASIAQLRLSHHLSWPRRVLVMSTVHSCFEIFTKKSGCALEAFECGIEIGVKLQVGAESSPLLRFALSTCWQVPELIHHLNRTDW